MNQKIEDTFDGARYVKIMNGFVFVWYGGHGIHVYSLSGLNEIDLINVGDFVQHDATMEQVKSGIKAYIEKK